MASSSLIASIDSILMRSLIASTNRFHGIYLTDTECVVKIGLRNLKVLLILRRSELQLELNNRIQDIIARLFHLTPLNVDMVREFQSFREEVDCELSNAMNMDHSSLLTADEILGICHCSLDSLADLLTRINVETICVSTDAHEVRDAYEVHTRFLTSFLHFGIQASSVGVDNLLSLIQPIAIDAARIFIKDNDDCSWYKHVGSKRFTADPQVYHMYSQALNNISPSLRNVDDVVLRNFLDSLISLLWDMLRRLNLDSGKKHQFKVLYERLRFCRAILKAGKVEKKILDQIGGLICNAGALICSPLQADLSDLLARFDAFQVQAEPETNPSKANEEDADEEDATNEGDEKDTTNDGGEKDAEIRSTPRIVGFQDDEVDSILDRLIRGSKQLSIVPICGMPGLGKTTFALQLYSHPSVLRHFQARAQCTISQELDKKKALVQLLNQIQPGDYLELSEYDLANKLRRSLKGRRYLILLDDVWTPEALENLKASFPDDSTDSRIIMTSRSLDIAQQPHKLRFRSDSECFEILNVKLMHTNGWNPEIGMKMAMVCKGLPLIIVIVAGLLATTKLEGWDGILDRLSSVCVSNTESLLELSFKLLPDYLQPCFLSFGAFPEDEEVPVKRLIRLWMAEGFVESFEDVGREYMQKLIERSLVMVSKYRSIGGVKTCRIHDLLRDFCLKKAKQESFFHLLQQRYDDLSDFSEPCNLQRLVIYSAPTHFKESRLFCPRAQSLLFFCPGESWSVKRLADMSFIVQIFQLLKVLDIERIRLTNDIPSEIELLTRLRYLAIQSRLLVIPTSVGKLSSLETFIARSKFFEQVSFPNTLWNLRRLIYLYVKASGFTLPPEDLENSSSLMELETLRGVVFYFDDGNIEKVMRKFPRVRRLKCRIKASEKSPEELQKIAVPLSHLELLTIRGYPKLKCEFGSTESLRKVTLKGLRLSREDISNIGKLPNLEVLKFYDMSFEGKRLEMEEEEFRKLRIFVMQGSFTANPLERWTASDDQLPCLARLDLRNLKALKELPSCLRTSETLEEIQVFRCSSTVKSLVRDVEQEHADFGNLIKE